MSFFDLGRAHHRRRRFRLGESSKEDSRGCKVIEFTRDAKGRKYPVPVVIERCRGKHLKATNRRQCRDPKTHLFTKCSTAKARKRRKR